MQSNKILAASYMRVHPSHKINTNIVLIKTITMSVHNQRMIQHQSPLQSAEPNPACVWYCGQHAHITELYANKLNFYNLETVFSPSNSGSITDSTCRPVLMTLQLCRSESKLLSTPTLPSYFSFKSPSFPVFNMAVACCRNR